MKTSLDLDKELLRQAREQTGIEDTSALIHEALRALIRRDAAKQVAALGGATLEMQPESGRRTERDRTQGRGKPRPLAS